jgi:glycosyltransferase involved in cell wall biosynthesis
MAKWHLKNAMGFRQLPDLYYVVPNKNWSIDWDGFYITNEINKKYKWSTHLISRPQLIVGQILHYGELGAFLNNLGSSHNRRNKVVTTIFHGDINPQYPELSKSINIFLNNANIPDRIVTACKIMEDRLISWGVPLEKIVRIPLGVDLDHFQPPSFEERLFIRKKIGIPDNAICIGSFHKDGVGWENGLEPKFIKGPDIFLCVIEKLSHNFNNIYVLLSAPARGYVKRGLTLLGIPYNHVVLPDYLSMKKLYHCLDTYLVTSREEGGPKGILESMACGIPIVSTRVGLAPDVIKHKHNGLLADIEDSHTLAENIIQLIENKNLRSRIITNGINDIKPYDWETIARRYYNELYKPLLDSMQ